MSFSGLHKADVGLTGVSPGILLLTTDLTNAQIQVPGYLNQVAPMSGVSVNNGDVLMASAADGGEVYIVQISGGIITLEAVGGTIPVGFKYLNTYWLASNGSDINDGKSIDSPLLTFSALHSKLVAGIPTVVNIVDSGVYHIATTFIVPCPLFINGPGSQLAWSGAPSGNMFFSNTFSPLIVNVGGINGNNTLQLFRGFSSCILTGPGGYCNIVNAARIWEDANSVSGGVPQAVFNVSTDRNGGSFLFKFGGEQIVNALNLGDSSISSQLTSGAGAEICKVKAHFWNGSASGTADYDIDVDYLGGAFSYTSSGVPNLRIGKSDLDVTNIPYNGLVADNPTNGNFPANVFNNPLYLFQQPIVGEIFSVYPFTVPASPTIWSVTLGSQEGNNQLSIPQNAANGNLTLPAGSTVPYGWRFHYQQTVGSGARVQIFPGSNDTLNGQNSVGPNATSCFTGIGTGKFVRGAANGSGGFNWAVENCFASNLLNQQVNVFISKINGDDSVADGTLNNQFATINAAKAYVIANYTANPSRGINLFITDDETYNEQLDFTGTTNINLIGREAQIIYSGVGDAFTANATMFLSMGGVNATGGGNAIVFNGGPSNALVANVDSVNQGNVLAGATGLILLQAFALLTGMSTTGGQIRYTTLFRAGVDGSGVTGISPTGASADWTVKNNIVSSTGSIQALLGNVIAGNNGTAGSLKSYPISLNAGNVAVFANSNTANVVTQLTNQPTSVPTIHALPNVAFGNTTLLPSTLTQVDPMSNLIYFDQTVSFSDLAGGASISLVSTFFGGQYRVRELFLNYSGTNLAGGDRDINITDGATVYSTIPSASLLTTANARWGSVSVPFPSAAALNTLTLAGINLSAVYSGGTTDYTSGSVTISGAWEKVV